MQNGQKLTGELLAIDEFAYVLLVRGRVGVAPFAAVEHAFFAQVGSAASSPGVGPSPRMRERVRLLSRFPYGIPRAAMTALLAESGQVAPDDLAATP